MKFLWCFLLTSFENYQNDALCMEYETQNEYIVVWWYNICDKTHNVTTKFKRDYCICYSFSFVFNSPSMNLTFVWLFNAIDISWYHFPNYEKNSPLLQTSFFCSHFNYKVKELISLEFLFSLIVFSLFVYFMLAITEFFLPGVSILMRVGVKYVWTLFKKKTIKNTPKKSSNLLNY